MLIKTTDIELISKLDKQCFIKSPYTQEMMNNMSKTSEFYLIMVDSNNVGFIILSKSGDDYELIKIGILAEYQTCGYAFASINELVDELSFKKLIIEVSEKNEPALKLYTKIGFDAIYKRKKYYPDGSAAIIMQYTK